MPLPAQSWPTPPALAAAMARAAVAAILAVGPATLAVGAVTLATPALAGGGAVLIEDFTFQPATVEVVAGGTVTWTMGNDPEQHTVTPDVAGAFEGSGYLFPAGASYSIAFATPGIYRYHCSLHPSMHGTVIVTVTASSPTPAPPTTVAASAVPTGGVGPTPGVATGPTPGGATAAPSSSGPAPGGGAPAAGADAVLPVAIGVVAVAAAIGFALLRLRGRARGV